MKQVFKSRLTLDHMATHVPHRFSVPEGMRTLQLEFSHDPHHPGVGSIPHQLSISVYGPNGPRGTRHNNADQSPVISTEWASPGYLKGPIEPGEWVVEIDVHRILPPGNVTYRISVDWSDAETPPPAPDPTPGLPRKQKRRGPGWYTGDLHGHTFHSDGDYSPAEYLAIAHSRGYDFVSLTDHNTFSAVPETRELAADTLTLIGGEELTTFNGHAVVLGLDGLADWRVKDGNTMSAIVSALQDAGALCIIVHPRTEGHPFCTGCRWAHADMLPGPVRHVEIWNNAWTERTHNQDAVQLLYRWLNDGLRMVAMGGSDTHRPMPSQSRIPANRVYARDNTEEEILGAMKRGHSYVTSGPDLSFDGMSSDGTATAMGDLAAPAPIALTCGWNGGASGADMDGLEARLISQGEEINRWSCGGRGEATIEVLAQAGNWFVLELRDPGGGLHALSNPIYVGEEDKDWR